MQSKILTERSSLPEPRASQLRANQGAERPQTCRSNVEDSCRWVGQSFSYTDWHILKIMTDPLRSPRNRRLRVNSRKGSVSGKDSFHHSVAGEGACSECPARTLGKGFVEQEYSCFLREFTTHQTVVLNAESLRTTRGNC